MSVTNGERLATKQDLADMYQGILPYLGGIVTSKAGFTPIGTIISVMGTTAPVNYLACDGAVYNIADYTELANYFNEQFGSKNFFGGNGTTTFAVPDLRGEFLRGTGTNSHANQGSGANVGVHQDATENPATFVDPGNNAIVYEVMTSQTTPALNTDSKIAGRMQRGYSSGHTKESGTTCNTYTARPTNTSVLYCIATKNFYIDPTLDYSTEEKIVGTWITGEPIYQTTFDCGMLLDEATKDIDTGIANIGVLVSIDGTTVDNTTKLMKPLPFLYASTSTTDLRWNSQLMVNYTNGSFHIIIKVLADRTTEHAYVTLRYTKTT